MIKLVSFLAEHLVELKNGTEVYTEFPNCTAKWLFSMVTVYGEVVACGGYNEDENRAFTIFKSFALDSIPELIVAINEKIKERG